jgi:hypothetical protein
MGRGFAGYAIALALIAALAGIHALELQHYRNVSATKLAMLEQQAITNAGEMFESTFCQVRDHAEWEKVMRGHNIVVECGDVGPDYYNHRGTACDWGAVVKPMPDDNGFYVAGGEHFGIVGRVAVGSSSGVHVIRSGTVCADK